MIASGLHDAVLAEGARWSSVALRVLQWSLYCWPTRVKPLETASGFPWQQASRGEASEYCCVCLCVIFWSLILQGYPCCSYRFGLFFVANRPLWCLSEAQNPVGGEAVPLQQILASYWPKKKRDAMEGKRFHHLKSPPLRIKCVA